MRTAQEIADAIERNAIGIAAETRRWSTLPPRERPGIRREIRSRIVALKKEATVLNKELMRL